MTKIVWHQGGATTPEIGAPTYGNYHRQCIVQPMNANPHATLCPQPKPKTQRTPTKGYQNGDGQLIGLTFVTHCNHVYTQYLVTYTQNVVTAAVKMQV